MDKMKLILFFLVTFIINLTIMTFVVATLQAPAETPKAKQPIAKVDSTIVTPATPDSSEKTNPLLAQLDEKEKIIQKQQSIIDSLEMVINSIQIKQTRPVKTASLENNAKSLNEVAKIYEKMPAEQAAKIIANLDNDTAARLILKMKKRQAAKILSQLQPDQAVQISRKIANYN